MSKHKLNTVSRAWRTVLGETVEIGDVFAGRDLWPVTAEDGVRYFLKRISPWRNLPLADEARVLRHLASHGVRVAEFLPTDDARLYAKLAEDTFILIPELASDHFSAVELVDMEEQIGGGLAKLHLALAVYPRSANSYTEHLGESLGRDLMLPVDVAEGVAKQRAHMATVLDHLPIQLIHGDLSPENVILRRPSTVSGFIDFDHLPLGPRIWDIAKYLSRRFRRNGSVTSEPDRIGHLSGFLRGYHNTNPLSASEIAALPSGIAAGNLLEISYMQEISAGTLARRKLPDHDAVLAEATEAARWHLANFEQVTAAVQASVV